MEGGRRREGDGTGGKRKGEGIGEKSVDMVLVTCLGDCIGSA